MRSKSARQKVTPGGAKRRAQNLPISNQPSELLNGFPNVPYESPDKESESSRPIRDRGALIAAARQEATRNKSLAAGLLRVGSPNASTYEIYAAIADQRAEELLALTSPPAIGSGGEVVPLGDSNAASWLADTLQTPSALNLEASYRRTKLLTDAGVFETAIDAAESINAENSLEKMLAHQLAACHEVALGLLSTASNEREFTEKTRLLNTATRFMTTFQDGLQTLQRVRSGGRQVVTVQHVNVQGGGQALVAGNVVAGSSPQGGRGRRK